MMSEHVKMIAKKGTYEILSKRGDNKLLIKFEAKNPHEAAEWAFKTAGIHSYKLYEPADEHPAYEPVWNPETAEWTFKTVENQSDELHEPADEYPVYEVELSYETDEDAGAKFWCFFDGLKLCNNVNFYITKGKNMKAHLDGYGVGRYHKAEQILFAAGVVGFGPLRVLANGERVEFVIDALGAKELEAKMTTLFDGARRYFGLSAYVE